MILLSLLLQIFSIAFGVPMLSLLLQNFQLLLGSYYCHYCQKFHLILGMQYCHYCYKIFNCFWGPIIVIIVKNFI